MTKTIHLAFFATFLLATSAFPGCGGGGPEVVEVPVLSAEDVAKAEAKRAEYEKQMKESNGN
ncbi:hypothetical protein [Neorhodopirellula pilleata]|uniref:Secreted protein n=1 Tax=Neorhodopirellula pilleata TaxID=2714738 RepID=A0A5C6APG2_9BACT|nr:hypothetical protein [Neorhodopirellula pilleata]TWU01893.1 hypothetical protein Pla100_16290 [Neorhodopirellula pilleata]